MIALLRYLPHISSGNMKFLLFFRVCLCLVVWLRLTDTHHLELIQSVLFILTIIISVL